MTTLAYSLIADVLASLENASGTPLGTAAHLRVQELVRQLPDDTQPEELKTLLAPLLCKSAEEQEQFYEMFRKSWARVQETGELAEEEIEKVEEAAKVEGRKRRWSGVVAGVLFLTAVAAFVWWRQPIGDNNPLPPAEPDTLVTNVLDSLNTPQEEKPQVEDTTLYNQRPIPHPRDLSQLVPPQSTATQQVLLAWEWSLKLVAILLSGLLLWWLARRIERKRRRLIAEHRPNVKPPYAWNLSLGAEPEVVFGEDFYNLLLQLRRRESDELWRLDVPRTIRATVDRGGLPHFKYAQQTRPAEYLLLIDRQSSRDHQARFFDLLYRAFRTQEVLVERYWYNEGDPRRCYNEAYPNGIPLRDLHYLHPQSRVLLLGNAYALLHPGTNQPAKWAIQTFSAWTDRAVLSTQPLSTFGRRERNLQDLFHVLPASLSGLRDAIELFDADENKTPDLNPRRFPDAAQEPIELIDNDLMKTLQLHFGATPPPTPPPTGGGTKHGAAVYASSPLPLGEGPGVGSLWLAACALYPELHWDLTLQLGQLLVGQLSVTSQPVTSQPLHQSPDNSSLITHHSLQALCRFPWFTEGEMPLEVRQTLLAWLEREHPELHYRLREGLHRLLSQNPPPEGSAAYDDFAMNLALNEWLYTRDRDRKKELQRDIAARLAAGQPADFMVLRMLDPQRALTPEQFEVPDDWKKHLREKGFAFLNPRRAWWWAVPMWLVLSGLALWWGPERVECDGLTATHRGREFCLENFEEWAIFREMLMQDTLAQGQMAVADSLSNLMLAVGWVNSDLIRVTHVNRSYFLRGSSIREQLSNEAYRQGFWPFAAVKQKPKLDSTTFLRNAAVAYFNQGVAAREIAIQQSVGMSSAGLHTGTIPPEKVDDSQFCPYFTRAQALNALLPDTLQLWYVRDAAKACETGQTSAVQDFALRGQMQDAATRGYLPKAAYEQAVITAKGLPPGYLLSKGQFRVDVPGGWSSPVTLSVTVPGYLPTTVVVPPQDFGKALVVRLRAQPKCYETLRAEGIALMGDKKYEAARAKFTAAAQCPDVPVQGDDLPGLLEQAGKLAFGEQQRIENEKAAEQKRLEDEKKDSIVGKRVTDVKKLLRAGTQVSLQTDEEISSKDVQIGSIVSLSVRSNVVVNGVVVIAAGAHAEGFIVSVRDLANLPSIILKINYVNSIDGQRISLLSTPFERRGAVDAKEAIIEKGTVFQVTVLNDSKSDDTKTKPKDLAAILAEIEKNMVSIPGGTFQMGCDKKRDGDCEDDEKPLHAVRLSGYSISKYEVTQAQWRAVMGSDPPELYNKGCDNCPVESVSWDDVQDFIKKLNSLTTSGKKYRLPTEAEWEYAARGGNKSQNYQYSGSNDVNEVAWYGSNYEADNTFGSKKSTRPVGTKKANELGLHDMSGNVWEWCNDWYDEKYYSDKKAALDNPKGPDKGAYRVLRGGSWDYSPQRCRAAFRYNYGPTSRSYDIGFRVALSVR